MEVLARVLVDPTIHTLYLRISGYQFPGEMQAILDVVLAVLRLISQQRTCPLDLWLDIASDVHKANYMLHLHEHHNQMREVLSFLHTTSSIGHGTILWYDRIRCQRITVLHGTHCHEERLHVEYLDIKPIDADVDLMSFLKELPIAAGPIVHNVPRGVVDGLSKTDLCAHHGRPQTVSVGTATGSPLSGFGG
jgi:hypothetical protein